MPIPRITTDQRRRLLVRNQLLGDADTRSAVEVADALVGLHSSDPVSVYLSLAARMGDCTPDMIGEILYAQRGLIRHHAMRRTLWAMSPRVASVAHAATTARYIQAERRRSARLLGDSTADAIDDEWFETSYDSIIQVIRSDGPMRTRDVGQALPELNQRVEVAQGKSYAGSISVHSRLLLHLGFEGRLVRGEPSGSWISSEYRWHLMEDWAPDFMSTQEPETARTALVSHWLESYGPGTETDIAWWSGLPRGMVRIAIESAGAVEVDLEGVGSGFALEKQLDTLDHPGPGVALLPGLDPTTMGWKERAFYLDEEDASLLFDRNGNAGPTVWADGRIVGGWVQADDGDVRYRLLRDVGREVALEVEGKAARLQEFWADTRFRVRFPAPLQRELLR